MRAILLSSSAALAISLLGTPLVIKAFRYRGLGQLIREDGPRAHLAKRGTPTMGGSAIIIAAVVGYAVATLTLGPRVSAGGWLIMGVLAAMGVVGLADDLIKLRRQRSVGLTKSAKFLGQALVAVALAWGAEYVSSSATNLSLLTATELDFRWLFVVWVFLVLSAASNAVNLTDGLDGLAAGASAFVFAGYTVIAFWQFRHPSFYSPGVGEQADGMAIAAASILGAVLGFLWWNGPPARIFMGDTGSLAIGGSLAALALVTETQLLLVVLAGLMVAETASVIVQVASFRVSGRRLFRMAPLHHHFELIGWQETTVIVRFWILGGLSVAVGIGLFYADYLARGGAG